MNTAPRTNTANGSPMMSTTLKTAPSASGTSARHSAAVDGAASRSFLRHFRFHSFWASRLSRASLRAIPSITGTYVWRANCDSVRDAMILLSLAFALALQGSVIPKPAQEPVVAFVDVHVIPMNQAGILDHQTV